MTDRYVTMSSSASAQHWLVGPFPDADDADAYVANLAPVSPLPLADVAVPITDWSAEVFTL